MSVLAVATPGAYSTVQDRGRFGYQHLGVPVSGALDPFAYRVANLLAGNPQGAAALELTVLGPRLEALAGCCVALAGADMGARLNGQALDNWRSVRLAAGDVLEFHQVRSGCRAYLAVAGGVDVPPVMGSRSTYAGGGIGGLDGRPLRAGDLLAACPTASVPRERKLPPDRIPAYPPEIVVAAVRGPQDDFFGAGLDQLFREAYLVTMKADRMGYRLQGPNIPIREGRPRSIVSEPSMPGGIQIPPDEQPIVLFVEQTVGGYAKPATVISADLGRVAQTTPGDTLRFEEVDLATAHLRYREAEERVRAIEKMLAA
jgi:biotin-dependent carboxylase-like uncharacterized protein